MSPQDASILLALATTAGSASQATPTLSYDPPPNFYRSASAPPEDYASNEFAASVQIYPFRPIQGDIHRMFWQTLLREWIDPRYQESNLAGPPEFRAVAIAGAEAAVTARFAESIAGVPRQRLRMLIVAGGAAAIVDAWASDLTTWQRALPALNAMSAAMRVSMGAVPPSVAEGPGAAGRAVAGLYMGTKPKYVVNLNRPVGYGSHVPALHYYLFSTNGRVYRAYDAIAAPGGDPSGFDFDAAARTDPVNSGRYSVNGQQLVIQMGLGQGQPPQWITTAAPQDGKVIIETVLYVRQ